MEYVRDMFRYMTLKEAEEYVEIAQRWFSKAFQIGKLREMARNRVQLAD